MIKYLMALALMFASFGSIAAEPVSKSYWGSKAIGGHDTVEYHSDDVRTQHKEVIGKKRFVVKWNNAEWLFASQASADKFAADPERYRPLYNGFCSNALSLGEGLISTDGTVWEFFGENLHLFYAERGRQRWLSGDWQAYKKEADHAWLTLNTQ
ncbi:YHS domain-containing (seleno)protein [Neptunomonas sp.]|uniref:YHS domain-containing (seleno)protein n=1 Tax=Neptunomonas sp. TaxID=1971898 RepID=UPI0025DBC24A|nr:YHS domain-containing (seleno)protein [Neptunomonas sp.]